MHLLHSLPNLLQKVFIVVLLIGVVSPTAPLPRLAHAQETQEVSEQTLPAQEEQVQEVSEEGGEEESLPEEEVIEEIQEEPTEESAEAEPGTEGQPSTEEEIQEKEGVQTPSGASSDSPTTQETQTGESPEVQALQEAATQSDAAVLITGDATALAAIFNLINTNFVNSQGKFVALSNLQELVGSIDVRAPNQDGSEGDVCDESDCTMLLVTENDAEVVNDVQVVAATGNNAAQGGGDVLIQTGNAYALASVFTFANATFVNSNYLVLSLNHAGDWNGDLILPSEDALASNGGGSAEVVTENDAEVVNDVNADAESGNNDAQGQRTTIATGAAEAISWVFNHINTNLVNTSFVHLVFNVTGSHSGNVFGLPFWLNYTLQPNGFVLWGTPPGSNANGGVESWTIDTNNNVVIDNSVSATATTGANTALSEEGDASIRTGTAYAIASAGNIANINVFGSNWLFGMFNIAGDWNGDISFGRPDIWVGQRAETPRSPLQPGDSFSDYITVRNDGDARATETTLTVTLDRGARVQEVSHGATQGPSSLTWDLGTLQPGEIVEVSYSGIVENDIAFGTSFIRSEAVGEALETDEQEQNNRDTLKLETYRRAPLVLVEPEEEKEEEEEKLEEPKPRLIVEKTNDSEGSLAPGEEVTFTIRVRNEGDGAAQGTRLRDTMMSQTGLLISDEVLELGSVTPGEEVIIVYTLSFNDALGGTFSNRAFVFESTGTSSSNDISSVEVVLPPPLQEEGPDSVLPVEASEGDGLGGASIQRSAPQQDTEESSQEEEPTTFETEKPEVPLQAGLLEAFGDSLWEWRWWLLVLTAIMLLPVLVPALRRRP